MTTKAHWLKESIIMFHRNMIALLTIVLLSPAALAQQANVSGSPPSYGSGNDGTGLGLSQTRNGGLRVQEQDGAGNDVSASHPAPITCVSGCSGSAGIPPTPTTNTAVGSSQIIKASGGTLFSFEASADSTLAAVPWWLMIFNTTTAPADGAVTPVKCYGVPSGSNQVGGTFASGGIAFSTGITMVVSTTGCFTKTASAHAFISGDAQ